MGPYISLRRIIKTHCSTLKKLSKDNRNEKLQLSAFELLSLLVPEDEFVKENDPAKVTELFVKNFNEAREGGEDRTADELLKGLKGEWTLTDRLNQCDLMFAHDRFGAK